MNLHIRNRASAVLYDYLLSKKSSGISGYYLIPSNICPVVVWTLLAAKVRFLFLDINKETLCLDESMCINEISVDDGENIAGVIFNHTYGADYNPTTFFNEIKSYNQNISIIDDRCLCKPVLDNFVDNVDLTLYSTGYGKYIDLNGGGYGLVNEGLESIITEFFLEDLKIIESKFKDAQTQKRQFTYLDTKWLDRSSTNTEVLQRKELDICKMVSEMEVHKNEINSVYDIKISEHLKLQQAGTDWRYNIWVNNKEEVLEAIFENGFFASSHYEPINNYFQSNKKRMEVSERLHNGVINLFNDYHFDIDKAEKVADIINKVAKV
jgi:hypothetical protein